MSIYDVVLKFLVQCKDRESACINLHMQHIIHL